MLLTRRDALRAVGAAGVGVAVGAVSYGGGYARHQLTRVDTDIPVSGLPAALDGLRVGLITDIHHSSTVSAADVTHAVDLLRSAAPDVVVLGGDYVTYGDRRYVEPVAELLSPLADAPHGSFAVLGNHDDDRDMPAALTRRRFTVLRDQHTRIVVRDEALDLVGIRFWTRRLEHIEQAVRGSAGTVLLLAHDPRRITQAVQLGIPLVLSGHTHGGQVVLPVVGAVAKRDFPVLAGTLRRERSSLFVSRGVGTVYVPMRLNCPPEIAVLTLRSVAAAD